MTWVNTERTYVQNQDDSDASNSVISVCDITIRYYGCAVMVSNEENFIAASVKATIRMWILESWKLGESSTPFCTETLKFLSKQRK